MSSNASERTFQNNSGPYVLPNDNEEHARLDRQSQAFSRVLGKTFHASVENPKRILDIGCGTGILSVELARRYPEAQVIGLDVACVPERRHGLLPNLQYIQGDIKDLIADEKHETFAQGSFDYVFSRLLMFGITDWPEHVKRLLGLLSSQGGWLELQEFNFEMYAGPNWKDIPEGTNLTAGWDWHREFVDDCAKCGLDMSCGKHLVRWMKAAGAVNVGEETYRIPPGGPPDIDQSDKDQAYWEKTRKVQEGLIDKVCSRYRSPEEVIKLKESMWSTFGKLEDGDWITMHVAMGQVN